ESVATSIGEAQGGADRLVDTAAAIRPEIGWLRDATIETGERLAGTASEIDQQRERFAALLSSVDGGVEGAQSKLAELASTLVKVEREATALSAETGPALVASLVQVKEAAAHAAERAREAIEAAIPEAASKLSAEAQAALEKVIRESVEERLRDVENVAARAVDSARSASDRLTQQMFT